MTSGDDAKTGQSHCEHDDRSTIEATRARSGFDGSFNVPCGDGVADTDMTQPLVSRSANGRPAPLTGLRPRYGMALRMWRGPPGGRCGETVP